MAKRAFYRKYRPRKISEVMGQPHITQSLENALTTGNISHAYLFSGPRGVGKTSVARIFAHEVNDIEYTDDSTHLDIIEIDAASNRRIDEIRDLRDKIGISPTSAPYKVYIIDEVHMLTKEAFNALLKTLEEPPEHAIFILATTEAYRLPDTILSRTQRYTFKPASDSDLARHLAMIAKKEKLEISDEALELIAEHASGSYRDGLSLLDQLATSSTSIDISDVEASLGLADLSQIQTLTRVVAEGDSKQLLEVLNVAFTRGVSAAQLAKQIVSYMQSNWSSGEMFSYDDLRMIDGLLDVQSSSEPEIKLTLVLLEACLNHGVPIASSISTSVVEASAKATTTPEPKRHTPPAKLPQSSDEEADTEVIQTHKFDDEAWQHALNKIKATNNSLYAVLRMAKAGLNGSDDVVILTFQFPFHQKQVSSAKNKKIVEEVLSDEMDKPISLKLRVDKDLEIKPIEDNQIVKNQTESDADINGIIDIMGGGEVVSI